MAIFWYAGGMNEIEITKQSYNRTAAIWSKTGTNSFAYEEAFKLFIRKVKKGGRVVEIGCANGINVPLFLGIGRHVKYEGYDFSKALLKIAKARYPQLLLGFMDITDSKTLPKQKYDAFYAAAVFMHVPQELWDGMFTNVEKILKPKGYGFITMPEQRPLKKSELDQRHFTLMNGEGFTKHLKARSWKVIKQGQRFGADNIPWNWFIVQLP